ncbi:MAG: ABC transporter substrate-binding protein, partial [Deltaproteobacteria bacterium]|nr:ABC transporter substrate-binding protein [Deltaproteobacteria bacterium]
MRNDFQVLSCMRKCVVAFRASLLVVCLSVFWGGLTAHALQRAAAGTAGKKITIEDANGCSMDVRLPVKGIVVLTSDALEVIRAIKAEGLVKGVNSGISKDPLFWPELKNQPSVGSWRNPNYELIAELNPDIVIGYAGRPGPVMERKLGSFGIQVVRLDFYKMLTLKSDVKILGQILNREKEARQLIAWYHKSQDFIQKGLEKIRCRPRVYVESYSKYHTTGPGSGGNEMCVLAGGCNIAEGFSIPYPEVSPEWVLVKNPQVIIKAAAVTNAYAATGSGALEKIGKEIMARPAWDNIRAVQEGRVYVMESSIWTGPRAIIGISYMA